MARGAHSVSHVVLSAFRGDVFRGNSPESHRFCGPEATLVDFLKTQLIEDAAGHFFDLR